MNNPDYIRIAHRRTVWSEVQRMLIDRFVAGDQPAKDQIICEEVPYAQKDVSQEAIYEVLEKLEQLQQDERFQMSQFEVRRRDVTKKPENQPQPSPQQAEPIAGQPAATVADPGKDVPREAEPPGKPSGATG